MGKGKTSLSCPLDNKDASHGDYFVCIKGTLTYFCSLTCLKKWADENL